MRFKVGIIFSVSAGSLTVTGTALSTFTSAWAWLASAIDFRDVFDAGVDVLAHALVESADRAGHLDLVGNDVLAGAAVNGGHSYDRGLLGDVYLPRHDVLQAGDDLRGGHHRVDSRSTATHRGSACL